MAKKDNQLIVSVDTYAKRPVSDRLRDAARMQGFNRPDRDIGGESRHSSPLDKISPEGLAALMRGSYGTLASMTAQQADYGTIQRMLDEQYKIEGDAAYLPLRIFRRVQEQVTLDVDVTLLTAESLVGDHRLGTLSENKTLTTALETEAGSRDNQRVLQDLGKRYPGSFAEGTFMYHRKAVPAAAPVPQSQPPQ